MLPEPSDFPAPASPVIDYREMLDSIMDMCFEVDLQGRLTYFNRPICRYFGIPAENLMGMDVRKVLSPKTARYIEEALQPMIRSADHSGMVLCYEVEPKSGIPFFAETTVTIVRDREGNPRGLRGITRDITKRKRAEDKIREKERFLTQVINSSAIATFVIDLSGRVAHWNPACARLTGYDAETMIGTAGHWKAFYGTPRRTLADLVLGQTPMDILLAMFPGIREDKTGVPGACKGEIFFPDLGPSGIWCFVTATPLQDESGSVIGVIETIQDISARKKAEQTLETLLKDRTDSLAETDNALNVLIEKWQNGKRQAEESVMANIREKLMPVLERLRKTGLSLPQKTLVSILENGLTDIASPLIRASRMRQINFTPMEIRVAAGIRQGMASKEMADTLHISIRTVEYHRANIRKKLGIQGKGANLQTTLQQIE